MYKFIIYLPSIPKALSTHGSDTDEIILSVSQKKTEMMQKFLLHIINTLL